MPDTRDTVVLVQPPPNLAGRPACLDDQQFGLGLLALAAWLQQHGFRTVGVHIPLALASGETTDEVVARILAADPVVVAIGLNWVHFSRGALDLASALKQRREGLPVVIGGQHASLFADAIARLGVVDAVIVGEAELPLLALCRAAAGGGDLPRDLPGLVRPDGTRTAPSVVDDIDTLPFYSYQDLRPQQRQPDVGALNTTRGACPFRCAYCVEPVIGRAQGRPRLQGHSPAWLAEQARHLSAEGIDRLTIQDGFFVGGDRALIALSAALRRADVRPRHLNLFAHPDSFGRAGLEAAAAAADSVTLDLGVETGSPAVARRVHRRLDPQQVAEHVTDAVDVGVLPYTWWMAGLPGETPDTWDETRDLIVETMARGAVPRWVSPLILLPGTAMHTRPRDYGVTPRFHTFEDYARFSETSVAEAVLFPVVATHETDDADAEAILAASRRLRATILDHFDLLERFWAGRDRRPDLDLDRTRVAASFF